MENRKHGYIVSIDDDADMDVEAEKECQRWLGTTEAKLKASIAEIEEMIETQ